jgi:hypothetical protein
MGRIRLKTHPVPRRQGVIITFHPLEDLSFDTAGERFRAQRRFHGPDGKNIPGPPNYQTPHLNPPSGAETHGNEKLTTNHANGKEYPNCGVPPPVFFLLLYKQQKNSGMKFGSSYSAFGSVRVGGPAVRRG